MELISPLPRPYKNGISRIYYLNFVCKLTLPAVIRFGEVLGKRASMKRTARAITLHKPILRRALSLVWMLQTNQQAVKICT